MSYVMKSHWLPVRSPIQHFACATAAAGAMLRWLVDWVMPGGGIPTHRHAALSNPLTLTEP